MPNGYEVRKLTPDEIRRGCKIHVPAGELETVDISDAHVEKMARGFILGSKAIGRRKEVRAVLEEKVTTRIGKKGKYLVDKLFELIDGVYIVDRIKGNLAAGMKGSEVRYYKTPPNLAAITYALDRVLGKPVARTENKEEKSGLTLVQNVIMNMANNPYKNDKRRDGRPGVEEDVGAEPGITRDREGESGGNGAAG
jgi:hypothetical protein